MAESTEITFGYLREFRKTNVLPILKDLRKQKTELEGYIDSGESESAAIYGVRAGNPAIFPAAGKFAKTVNGSVVKMRDEINILIEEFEGLDTRLEEAEIRFTDVEDDAVLTAYQLAVLIDPENAAGAGAGSGSGNGE
ncbi:hypothetical protein ACFO4E_20235 [Nocardiopsis mangrovi]|uniref:Uncharacterized protein n=1 Tax=Nocardiopsis mangrovi TaxID=1179818 RepID=A0ABV9DZ70_9ACTN